MSVAYLAVMDTVMPALRPIMSKHLRELMSDVEVYGCALIRAYHMIWLQQIENGQATWAGTDTQLEFWRALVWHAAPSATKSKQPSKQHHRARRPLTQGEPPQAHQSHTLRHVVHSTSEAAFSKTTI